MKLLKAFSILPAAAASGALLGLALLPDGRR